MAIKLVVNISKKVPITGLEYSSVQASCSIEGEIAANQDPAAEAERLYAAVEAAVDRQLGIAASPAAVPAPASASPNAPISAPSSSPPHANPSAPAPRRRVPSPATAAQLSFLNRLIAEGRASLGSILAHHAISGLRDLSCKQASEIIDELKTRAVRP